MKRSMCSLVVVVILMLSGCQIELDENTKVLLNLRTTLQQQYKGFDDIEVQRRESETKEDGVLVGKSFTLMVKFIDKDISYRWRREEIDTLARYILRQYPVEPLDSVQIAIYARKNGEAVTRIYSFPVGLLRKAQ